MSQFPRAIPLSLPPRFARTASNVVSTAKLRYSVGPLVGRGPTASCSGVMMSEPTVDEIMEKAKQLCRLDGMLWSKLDFQNPMAQQIRTTARLAGEAVRRRYLKRAQTLLDTEAHVSSLEAQRALFPALHRSGRTIAQITRLSLSSAACTACMSNSEHRTVFHPVRGSPFWRPNYPASPVGLEPRS